MTTLQIRGMDTTSSVDVRIESSDGLVEECWEFCFTQDHGLFFRDYTRSERTSPRRKFGVKEYFRLRGGSPYGVRAADELKREQVPMPDYVLVEAKRIFMARAAEVTVVWEDAPVISRQN